MSRGGGAGKVYFVLYLAVVLELLIIIVERDEAEEGLHKKQKETMKIVESILSQLQSGAGTEGINTRPQDEITIPPSGINIKEVLGSDIKSYRNYTIEVGVTDVSADLKKKDDESSKEYLQRIKKLVELANVADLEYQIFYNSSEEANQAPMFVSDREIKKQNYDFSKFTPGQTIISEDGESEWEFLGLKKLELDNDATFNQIKIDDDVTIEDIIPIYPDEKKFQIGDHYAQTEVSVDSIFYYSKDVTERLVRLSKSGLQKRAFVVNFEPPRKAGWYKLRFASRTNKILGVRADVPAERVSDDATVNIGTVELTVKALRQVRRSLETTLDKYQIPSGEILSSTDGLDRFDEQIAETMTKTQGEDDAAGLRSKINLYNYIAKLLTPGMSVNFDQNKGAIEFNVRVITPQPKTADPVIFIADELHRFDANEPRFKFEISPYQGGSNSISGAIYNAAEGTSSVPIANVTFLPVSEEEPPNGSKRAYYGKADMILQAGTSGGPRKYIVKLNHQLMGKSVEKLSELTIYKTLDEDKIRDLSSILENKASYGNYLQFNYIPTSGNKILPEQFCYKFETDADAQPRGCVIGYTAKREANLFFHADASKASLEIVWKDPITDEEIPIFPKKEVAIIQSTPKILINQSSSSIGGSEDRIKVRITGIKVRPSDIGVEDQINNQQSKVSVDAEITKVRVTRTYKKAGNPKVTMKDDIVTIEFDLIGEPDEEGMAKGDVDIKITAVATNPINGKTSRLTSKKYTVKVRKKFDLFNTNYYNEE